MLCVLGFPLEVWGLSADLSDSGLSGSGLSDSGLSGEGMHEHARNDEQHASSHGLHPFREPAGHATQNGTE